MGVLSDTHGRLDSAILDLFAGCDYIIHAGDVGDWTIVERLHAVAPVTAVRGNCDDSGDLARLPATATVILGDVTVLVIHDLLMVEVLGATAFAAIRAAGRGVVVSGHTHLAAINRENGVLFLNPGSASLRRYEAPRSVALLRIGEGECAAEIHELRRGVSGGKRTQDRG